MRNPLSTKKTSTPRKPPRVHGHAAVEEHDREDGDRAEAVERGAVAKAVAANRGPPTMGGLSGTRGASQALSAVTGSIFLRREASNSGRCDTMMRHESCERWMVLRRAGLPVVLAAVLLLVLLLNKVGVLAPDIKPEIYMAPWREAEALSRAWRESPKLGEPNFNVGLFPVAWVVGVIQALGSGPDLSMRLLRWVLVLLGAGARAGSTRSSPVARRGGSAAVAVAVLYVANPYMVTAGDFLANVLPAALLPVDGPVPAQRQRRRADGGIRQPRRSPSPR